MRIVSCLAPLTRESFTTIKHAIRDAFPLISSGHADEAVAYALGFHTYAALLPMIAQSDRGSMPLVAVSEAWLVIRLLELGYDLSAPPQFTLLRSTLASLEFPATAEMERRETVLRDLMKPRPANDP